MLGLGLAHAFADQIEFSLDGFVGGGAELSSIFIGKVGTRGVVSSFGGRQPR